MTPVYRYAFDDTVDFEGVRVNFNLALMSVQALHGETAARMDARHHECADDHVVVVDASTEVGRDLNRLFTGYLRRELGSSGFEVERLVTIPAPMGVAA